MLKKVIFWGASGHAKVLREFIASLGYEIVAIFDNDNEVRNPFPDVPLYHGTTDFRRWIRENEHQEFACLVAIGGAKGRDRLLIQRMLEKNHLSPIVAVHPSAYVATDSVLAKGCQVLANASICSQVQLSEACIINTGASVDHESILGDGVHIAPGAVITGCVSIGDYTMIGAGAIVLPRVTIGSGVIVGAGAVVTRNVADNSVVYGNPARVQRPNLPDLEKIIG